MNPLNKFNANVTQQPQQQMGNQNPMQMVSQFMNFAKDFKGDPEQAIQQMLNSGKMTQEQLNQIIPMAKQIQEFLSQMGIKL